MKQRDEIEELTELINDFFGCDAMYYGVDSYALAHYLFDSGFVIGKQSGWISVEDALPQSETERVLVFLKDADFTKPIGVNKIDTDRYVDSKWVRWGRYVTHWMPLSELPKVKGETIDRIYDRCVDDLKGGVAE